VFLRVRGATDSNAEGPNARSRRGLHADSVGHRIPQSVPGGPPSTKAEATGGERVGQQRQVGQQSG
jgi:hypothetical protein